MLIEKIHDMYKNDKVTLDIFTAIEKMMNELESDIAELERQRLLDFASWYIECIESELGINEKADTLEKRCNEVRRKLLTRGKVSLSCVEELIKDYSYHKVVYNATKYELVISLALSEIDKVELDKLQKELRAYLPAHILISYKDRGRTHDELSAYTHQELSKFTHQELNEKGVL